MRLPFAKAAALLFLCASAVTSVRADEEKNLLSDPGFENVRNGVLLDWRNNTSSALESIEVIQGDPQFVRSGKYSAKLVQQQKLDSGELRRGHLYTNQDIAVEANTKYSVGVWVKGNGKVSAMVYLYGGPEGKESFRSSRPLLAVGNSGVNGVGDDWRQQRYLLDTTGLDPNITKARLVLEASGIAYVDDASFTRDETTGQKPMTQTTAVEPKTATSPAAEVRPNLFSVGMTTTSPKIDGVINDDEYSSVSTGLIDTKAQAFYPLQNKFAMSYDA